MGFRVLGPLEVWSDGERLALPGSRHQRVLASLLLAPETAVPLGKLIEATWDDEPPATATKQVQNCVSALRERLGSKAIVTEGPGYRAVVAEDELDLLRFTNGVAAARRLGEAGKLSDAVTHMRSALRLWRGPALDGLGAAALAARATRLDEQRLNALEQCIDWELSLGAHRDVTDELTELTTEHPLRERPHGQLMRALASSGRQADAIEVFHRLRTHLADELGIDPSTELAQLHEKVLRGELAPSQSPDTPPPVQDQLDRAARELAAAVARQWTTEAELRSLHRPHPVPLTWSSTGRPVTAANAQRLLSGGLTDLVAKFRSVPNRQLVVLGEPGAGKSVLAILLTLGLLKDPRPDDPVPVLFSLESWNPRREHLHRWLARRLVRDYPGLANKTAYGPHAPTRLILDGRIMPILDGLDEIPPALHAAAIDALDQVASNDRPLVVTSRSAEYELATNLGGTILSRAAVVEIAPVGLEDAIDFLTARRRRGEDRWQPVIDHLRQHPDGPLAQALRTPLMVDLARTAYAHPDSQPAELCEVGDRTAIEDKLLDAYLPAAYEKRPEPLRDSDSASTEHYDAEHAARWLTFLAEDLQRRGTRDLAWWRLDRALPRVTRGLLLGLPAGLLFGLTGWLAGGPRVGLVYGLSFALAGGIAHAVGPRSGPLRVEFRMRGTGVKFLWRFGVGVLIGVALGLSWSLSPMLIGVLCVAFGLGVGSLVWVATPIDVNRVSSPESVLRDDRFAAWAFMLSFTVSLGLFDGVAFAFTQEVRFLTVWNGQFDLILAVAAGLASAFLGRFLLGNVGAVTYGIAGALVGGQVFPRATSITSAVIVGTLFGLAVALTFGLARAWGSYVAVRAWLAARGDLPPRLMRFLDDAHRRGVLRQVGALYQFRHARLQDRLSSCAGTDRGPGSRT